MGKYSPIRNLADRAAHTGLYDLHRYLGAALPLIEDSRQHSVSKVQENGVISVPDPTQVLMSDLPSCSIEWKIPELHLYNFQKALLAGKVGYLFTPDGRKLYDCSVPNHIFHKTRRPIQFLGHKFSDICRYFHLRGESIDNRAHFIIEHAPRLLLANDCLERENSKILLINSFPAWYSDYLKLFDITEDRFVEGSLGTDIIYNLDYIPHPEGSFITFSHETYFRLCSFLHGRSSCLVSRNNNATETIWITRSDANTRRLVNAAELIKVWEQSFGRTEMIALSDLSLTEQLKRLAPAKCIIAEQGQALNLIPFFRGKVIVMLDNGMPSYEHSWNTAFFTMAFIAKNFMIRLFSNEKDVTGTDWHYPEEKFKRDLQKIRMLSSDGKLQPEWYKSGMNDNRFAHP